MSDEIKRYAQMPWKPDYLPSLVETPRGELVKHADHLAAIAELRSRLEKAEGDAAEGRKWEELYDEFADAISGEVMRDSYGPVESDTECVKRLIRERDALRTALETIAGYEESEEISSSEEELRTTLTARNALEALKFYADKEHFSMCSDESGRISSVEDGTKAREALEGKA